MTKIILASGSPRRQNFFREMRLDFLAVPSGADERTSLTRPSALVKNLALKKARDVASRYPDSPVVGSDTIVVCKGEILGKPKDSADAMRILRLENASWQKVYTGVAVVWKSKNMELVDYEVSACKARRLTDAELARLSAKHHDKAGAYAVQDKDDPFIEKIVGNFDNVMGLPCRRLAGMLEKAGAVRRGEICIK